MGAVGKLASSQRLLWDSSQNESSEKTCSASSRHFFPRKVFSPSLGFPRRMIYEIEREGEDHHLRWGEFGTFSQSALQAAGKGVRRPRGWFLRWLAAPVAASLGEIFFNEHFSFEK